MEIGEQAGSTEDSILNNISSTRDLWNSVQSNKNTDMLQPKSKVRETWIRISVDNPTLF